MGDEGGFFFSQEIVRDLENFIEVPVEKGGKREEEPAIGGGWSASTRSRCPALGRGCSARSQGKRTGTGEKNNPWR